MTRRRSYLVGPDAPGHPRVVAAVLDELRPELIRVRVAVTPEPWPAQAATHRPAFEALRERQRIKAPRRKAALRGVWLNPQNDAQFELIQVMASFTRVVFAYGVGDSLLLTAFSGKVWAGLTDLEATTIRQALGERGLVSAALRRERSINLSASPRWRWAFFVIGLIGSVLFLTLGLAAGAVGAALLGSFGLLQYLVLGGLRIRTWRRVRTGKIFSGG